MSTRRMVLREVGITLRAIAGGWPGLVFLVLVMLVAITMESR